MAVADREKQKALLESVKEASIRLSDMLVDYQEKEKLKSTSEIPQMELNAFEGYDYLVLIYKNQLDWLAALDYFEVGKQKIIVNDKGDEKLGLGRVIDGAKAMQRLKNGL